MSLVVEPGLSCPVADRILVPCSVIEPAFKRQILNHWITREVPSSNLIGYKKWLKQITLMINYIKMKCNFFQEKGMTEDEMVEWYHQFDRHEFEQVPRVGDGQGCLVC